jgi:mRNA interferase RelE/StbE
MNQVFYTSFYRDIKRIKNKGLAEAVKDFLELTSLSGSISGIPNIVKIKGHKTAYRFRVNEYRIGFFFEDNTIYFAAFDHRKNIYKRFP